MRLIYTILLYFLIPLFVLRLFWKSRKNSAYRHGIKQRFACVDYPNRAVIWIHAVSLGEVNAAAPLVNKLRQQYPQQRILITNMTPTGSQRVRQLWGDKVDNVYLPYDTPAAVNRFLERVQPICAIYMETEIWPNLYHACRQHGISQCIVNGRMSPRSHSAYQRIRRLVAASLQSLDVLYAQNQADAERFIDLGMAASAVNVVGNLKYDMVLPADLAEKAQAFRQLCGAERKIWIAASTHPGEEEQVLAAFASLRQQHPHLLLLLIPRHPERAKELLQLTAKHGFKSLRRSELSSTSPAENYAVIVGDTMGELLCFYRASDVVFVGGSLVAHGGQNLLEPAALALPIVSGPHLFNFQQVQQQLVEAQALQIVHDAKELANSIDTLLVDEEQAKAQAQRGQAVFYQHRGAVDRVLAGLAPWISRQQQ